MASQDTLDNTITVEELGFYELLDDKKRWKKFKKKISIFLDELGFNDWEFDGRPDTKPKSLLYDQFQESQIFSVSINHRN